MAALHDGRVTVRLTAKVAWWVHPYLWTTALFIRSIAPFMPDLDNGRIDAFVERQAAFVTRHGIRFYCGGRRV